MIFRKTLILFLICIFPFSPLLQAHGFCAGTKINGPQGYSAIEDLAIGSRVLSYDYHENFSVQPLIAVTKAKASHFIRIWFKDHYLDTSSDQLFSHARKKKWVAAKALEKHDILLCNRSEELVIDAVESIEQEVDVYVLSVNKSHTYYVTDHNILVHNIVPIVIGVSFAFGGGTIEFMGISAGVVALGAALGFKYFKDKAQQRPTFYDHSIISKDNLHQSSNVQPTITIETDIAHTGCGGIEQPTIEDYILIQPLEKPQLPISCIRPPEPIEKPKPGCGEIPQPKVEDNNGGIDTSLDKNLILSKEQEKDPRLTQAGAPGKPTEKDGFIPPKKWDGKKVPHPETGQYGYPDKYGSIWVPSGLGNLAHGGPHWDVIDKHGDHRNVRPKRNE